MATNLWTLHDYLNGMDAWLTSRGWYNRKVFVMKFLNWVTDGNPSNVNEQFREAKYASRNDTVWLSQVKVYDTVKGGYFTTGDLNVSSTFILQGYSPAYTLADSTSIPEYAGDEIVWNGKIWVVADQLEPRQYGTKTKQVWYSSVLRRAQRSGLGTTAGPQ
jgi:hypothetical protein